MRLKRFEQARWRLDRAVEIDDNYIPAHMLYGEALLKLDPERAERHFKRIFRVLDPANWEACRGLGKARSELEDYEEAARLFERAREQSQGPVAEVTCLLDLAEAQQDMKLFEEARGTYRRVEDLEARVALPPVQRLQARRGSAGLELELRSWEQAISNCEGGLRLFDEAGERDSPDTGVFHYLTGVALFGSHRYEDALAALERAATISAELAVHSYLTMAVALAFQGKYEDAYGTLREVKRHCSRLQEAGFSLGDEQLMSLGSALLWLQKPEQAEPLFRDIVSRRPTKADAWTKLMMVCLERREQSVGTDASRWQWEAYEAYSKVVLILERKLERRRDAGTLEALGLLHLLMDERDEADSLLAEAARLNPNAPTPHTGLGISFVKRGCFPEAIEELERSLRRDPQDLTVQCYLADARFRAGRVDAAAEAYREVLQVAPGNVGAYLGLGEVLIEQAEKRGDDLLFAEAASQLDRARRLAASVQPGSEAPEGSSGLALQQWSDLYYLRGYVLVKRYQSLVARQLGRVSGAARQLLREAGEEFEEAIEMNVKTHQPERALEQVRARLDPFTVASSYAPYAIAAVSVLLLLLVQVAFVTSGSFADGNVEVGYATLTLALIMLLIACLYLPEVLKLRFGDMEIEKTASSQPVGDAIEIARQKLGPDLHGRLEPTIPFFKEPRTEGIPSPLPRPPLQVWEQAKLSGEGRMNE